MEHNFTKHENCHLTSCTICEGGLGFCTVCGCLEGQLATECPGFDVGSEIGDLIWKGIVDFISGNWIFKSRFRDWWTIKIFTITLLFLITVIPAVGECFTSKPAQENWIHSPSDYSGIMNDKVEDLVLERDGARWHFAGAKVEPEKWIHWFGVSGNIELEQIMTGQTEKPKQNHTITFHNTDAKHTIVYYLYHIDHGFHTLGDVIPIAGELKPLEHISKVRNGGVYYVVWREQHTGRVLKSTEGFELNYNMDFYYP